MEEQQRMQSTYLEEGMERILLAVIGIMDDAEEIERQRKIALTSNVDRLIHLRELSEAVQLYKRIGCVRFTELKQWDYRILSFFLRQEHKGKADSLRADIITSLFTPFSQMHPRATYKTEEEADFPLSSLSNSYIKKAPEHLNKRYSESELVETLSSIYNAIKEEDRDRKSNTEKLYFQLQRDRSDTTTVDCAVKTDDDGLCERLSTCSLNQEEQDKTVLRPGDDFTLLVDCDDLL
jgi:hypothetical protein